MKKTLVSTIAGLSLLTSVGCDFLLTSVGCNIKSKKYFDGKIKNEQVILREIEYPFNQRNNLVLSVRGDNATIDYFINSNTLELWKMESKADGFEVPNNYYKNWRPNDRDPIVKEIFERNQAKVDNYIKSIHEINPTIIIERSEEGRIR